MRSRFGCRSVILSATCILGLTLPMTRPAAADDRPNVLFILTDDQAPWALGLSGHPHARTPHLDRLFEHGAYLVNSFVVTPVCSPSRASLMTSRYGSELGITDWINPRNEPDLGLEPGTPTWPNLLQAAGYRTALIGKWHLGTRDEFHPGVFGYQDFFGFRPGGARVIHPSLEVNGEQRIVRGLTTDILTDEAIRWLRLHDPATGPFALSLHYRAPHAPWLPLRDEDWSDFESLDPTIPNPDYPKLDVERVKRMTREYLGSVAGVDRNVGRLLAELDLLGLEEKTIVIFTSDHGYNMGHNGIWHKGNGHWVLTENPPATETIPAGQRPNMYDHSIRVPTAVRWPGVVSSGTVIEQTVANIDWFPTLLDMTGVELPDDITIRGRSIVPLLRDERPDWNNDLYAEYSTHHQSETWMRMYRTPEWKLIKDFRNPDRDELYNLQDDPAETHNLYGSTDQDIHRIKVNLQDSLMTHMEDISDPVWWQIVAPP